LPFIGVQSREGADQERIAINMPFQGLAADLIKISMVKIFDYLKENQLLDFVKLNVQIHDELLFEIKSDIINEITPTIQRFLEDNELGVPLKVNISIGNN